MDRLTMAKALPPLTWFRAFEAAARALSFTAAAEELGMTQSAVSQHVKALETRLGVRLFIRRPRGLALTDDGRKLLPQVGAALDTLAAAARGFETGPAEDLLTIASSISMAEWVIAPHLSEFKARAPGLRIRFISTIWPDDFHAVRADVEIAFGSAKQVGRNATLLEPNRLIALKAPGLDGGPADLPLIEAVGTSDGWHRWPESAGGALRPEIFVDSYGAALTMARAGNGVALVTELLAHHALAAGTLVRAHAAQLPSAEGYHLRVSLGDTAAQLFRDWLIERLDAAAAAAA
ncbi:LysR family transcriptional regulator [Roseovarius aquimarinus]|uniref:LysR family transcriptional regulator n=1 Tax=Roseovarius aquimarinus TaxID=1229156 RepID=A0ABW7I645_9RHOB